ncbi:MAG: ArnT family glycosyltransferase, partial [Candidatus Levyibacteriota bacterium]
MLGEILYMLFDICRIFLLEIWHLIKYLWHHPKVLLLTIILLAVITFQFYRLSSPGSMLGNNGLDIAATQDIFRGHLFPAGPTAPGSSYATGPLYYYLVLPFVWIFGQSGTIVMVEIFTFATIYLFFFTGRRFFNKDAGLFSATLYAISTFVLTSSRESAIAAIIPFFVLLFFYMFYCAIGNAKPAKYFILTGFFLGLCIQLNSFALFFLVILVLYTFFGEWLMHEQILIKATLKYYALIVLGLILGIFPMILADIPDNFANSKQMFQASYGAIVPAISQPIQYASAVLDGSFRTFMQVVFNMPSHENLAALPTNLLIFWQVFGLLMTLGALALLAIYRNRFVIMLLGSWTIFGLLFFGVFSNANMYHLSSFYPIPFLLIGNVLGYIYRLFYQDPW